MTAVDEGKYICTYTRNVNRLNILAVNTDCDRNVGEFCLVFRHAKPYLLLRSSNKCSIVTLKHVSVAIIFCNFLGNYCEWEPLIISASF